MQEIDETQRRVWRDDRGSLTMARVPPHVGLIIFDGRLGDDAAPHLEEHFDWVVITNRALVFLDGGELSFLGARFISTGSSLILGHRDRFAELHVLVSNPMTQMIAKTVNLTLGGFMTIHRKRELFEAEQQRALELQGVPA